MAIDPNNEKFAVDYMTHAMLSTALLTMLTQVLYSDQRDTMTVGQLYDEFNKTHDSKRFRPFNEGVILSVLYWIIFAKENWPDLVPDDDYSAWGIKPVRLSIPKEPNPKLKYFVRRLRNALGHGTPTIKVSAGATLATVWTETTISFHDANQKDRADTFYVELTLEDALKVAKKLHKIILEDAGRRHGVTPPPSRER